MTTFINRKTAMEDSFLKVTASEKLQAEVESELDTPDPSGSTAQILDNHATS